MRKSIYRIFLLVFLLCMTKKAFVQTPLHRFAFSLAAGPSFPAGNFSSKSIDSGSASGWANTGIACRFGARYLFNKSPFGLILSAEWQHNKRDNAPMEQTVKKWYPGSGSISADARSWGQWKLLAGPVFEIPVSPQGRIYFAVALA